jgi:8-oxo-dGTP pyrophosphatase MutT (NUDIX family)
MAPNKSKKFKLIQRAIQSVISHKNDNDIIVESAQSTPVSIGVPNEWCINPTGWNSLISRPVYKVPSKKKQLHAKTSVGIILCKKNNTSGRLEVLLANKRYTYAFAEFVHGRYSRNSYIPFNDMTLDELFDILSLNFEQMWYRIWLTNDNKELYVKKHAKFYSTFMRDGGVALKAKIMASRANGTLLWEVPKGRRQNPHESDLVCAIRELYEETGVEKKDYKIIPGIKKKISFVSAGVRYNYIYYVALAGPRLTNMNLYGNSIKAALRDISHIGEIGEIKWHDIERIRMIDGPQSKLESLLTPIFKIVKQYTRGRWAARCYSRDSTSPEKIDKLFDQELSR